VPAVWRQKLCHQNCKTSFKSTLYRPCRRICRATETHLAPRRSSMCQMSNPRSVSVAHCQQEVALETLGFAVLSRTIVSSAVHGHQLAANACMLKYTHSSINNNNNNNNNNTKFIKCHNAVRRLQRRWVTTIQREKTPTFLDEIADNMSNRCKFINPNSPRIWAMNYSTNKVQASYMMIWERVHTVVTVFLPHHNWVTSIVELTQSNFPDYTNCLTFPWLWAFSLTFLWP